jgi:hypothetical protein
MYTAGFKSGLDYLEDKIEIIKMELKQNNIILPKIFNNI